MNNNLLPIASTLALAASASLAHAQPRADVDFAFGGATTSSANATDAFATQNPDLAVLLGGIRAGGLDVIGLSQQLTFARATLNDVAPQRDLFWVYAGINDYLAGGQDPSAGPARLAAALESLYTDVGARRFVVPNLPSLGDLPLFAAAPQPVRDGLTQLTLAHNQILAAMVAQFVAAHASGTEEERVEVTAVDVFSIFQAHKTSGVFADVTSPCDQVFPPEQLAVPGACNGFLYLDIVHPASAAWAPVAQTVADSISRDVDRIITLGDSFSDLGSMSDTFVRTVGFPFPRPPFTAGRFTEADNVVEQTEDLLGTLVKTRAFSQPKQLSETVTGRTDSQLSGRVFVPKRLGGNGSRKSKVMLKLSTPEGAIECSYKASNTGFVLASCEAKRPKGCDAQPVRGGDLVEVESIDIKPKRGVASVTIDWLYY